MNQKTCCSCNQEELPCTCDCHHSPKPENRQRVYNKTLPPFIDRGVGAPESALKPIADKWHKEATDLSETHEIEMSKPESLRDCSGCTDRNSEGTHAMHTKQHPCMEGGDPNCGYCFPEPESEWAEELARQLHDWYLEATEQDGAKYNHEAVVPYDDLPEGSKLLDRFIAKRILNLYVSKEKIREARKELIEIFDGCELADHDRSYINAVKDFEKRLLD